MRIRGALVDPVTGVLIAAFSSDAGRDPKPGFRTIVPGVLVFG